MSLPTRSATYASVIGAVLSEERERRVMTQASVAAIAGLTQSTWGRMELGRACTLENLGKASVALNIKLWELMKVVDDRVAGLENQGIQVVYELPTEEELKANQEHWVVGSSQISKLSLVGLGALSGIALGGVSSYIASIFKK
ncbi:helix-turn-helix domain-containing protein [Pseudomonas sp. NY15437]|uniref:helix-turn-helix domain-containing protein n=1 Tax=Pseudomonas sp. NY15437 TaxID=3400360 RepID=UPI003A864C74